MEAKLLRDGSERTWAVVFSHGDRVMEGLERFAAENQLNGAHFTAIGAFENATLYYFDWGGKEYREIPVDEQVEVLTMAGNVARKVGDEVVIHAHVVLGDRNGQAHGGHLKEATARPTLEVILTETPEHLRRTFDRETGLALIRP